jgi:DNA-binding CsgD family transcriptional regulator
MLVGRTAQTERIDALLENARHGRCGSLVLVGSAGCGKSALLEYAVGGADDMTVARATGIRSDADIAFAGLLELTLALPALEHRLPEPQARALRAALARGERARLDRLAIGGGTLALLAAAAEDEPVLVILDDVQWLDRASAEAILFAARRLSSDRIAFLLALRDSEPPPIDLDGLDRIVVDELDRADTGTLAAHVHSRPLPALTVDRIHEVTRGNPLAIWELTDISQLELPTGAAPVSAVIEDVYARRAAALSPNARTAVTLLAADEGVSRAILERALAAMDVPRIALEEAEAAGLVSLDADRIRFRHPLVRAAVYQRAAADERRRAHATLAAALVDTDDFERRVLHRAAAAFGIDDDLSAELATVADSAASRHAYAAAAAALERAAELASVPIRASRLHQAAQARWQAGDVSATERLVREALAAGADLLLRADIQVLHANVLSRGGRPREAFELLLAEGRRIVPYDRERAAVMFSIAAGVANDAALFCDAVAAAALADETAETPTGTRPLVLSMAGRYAEAVPLFERALATGSRNDPASLALASDIAGLLCRYADAYRFAIAAVELARHEGSPLAAAKAAQVALDQAFVAGDLAASAAYGDEGLAIARQTGQRLFVAWCAWSIGVNASARGDEQILATALAELALLPQPTAWGAVRDAAAAIRGSHRLGIGDPAGALAELEDAVDLDAAQVGNVPIPAPFDLAEAHVRASDLRSAERVLDRLAAGSQQKWAVMALNRTRGLYAAPADGDDLFRRALDACERHAMVFEGARTRMLYGEWLRRHRRRLEAREQLRAALRQLDAMGARPLAARAAAELAASGETHVIRHDSAPVDGLTPRELRVASLAAEGLTNREIAGRLFLSPKTIEAHLRSIYGTLGIHGRTELPDALVRVQPPPVTPASARTADAGLPT